MEGGHVFNVFPDTCTLEGSIRTFDDETLNLVKERINTICTEIGAAMNCTVDVTLDGEYPAVINHTTETNHVIRLAKEWFGPEHFLSKSYLFPLAKTFRISSWTNQVASSVWELPSLESKLKCFIALILITTMIW
jgi:metal-dependent amidase/aminoacylase/carboxypeptidase family protein